MYKYLLILLVGLSLPSYAKNYDLNITGEIRAPLAAKLNKVLGSATSHDVVTITLDTPGGSVAEGLQIIKDIHASKAKVISIVSKKAESMGAIIFFATPIHGCTPDAVFLFHTAQYCDAKTCTAITPDNSKGDDLKELQALYKYVDTLTYKFLDYRDWIKIQKGYNLFITCQQIHEREVANGYAK